jgi:hypothetical protein
MKRIRAWFRRIVAEFMDSYRGGVDRGKRLNAGLRDRLERRLVAQQSRIAIMRWEQQGRPRVRVVTRDV